MTIKVICPVCRGTGKSDFGLGSGPQNGCSLCGTIGLIKLAPRGQEEALSRVEMTLLDIRQGLLSVANPYIDVPQSVENVHSRVLDQIEDALRLIRSVR